MSTYSNYFKGKTITLMGLGLLGRGVGDARFLAEQGARVLVTDLKSEEELKESVNELKGHENISFVLGGHREEDFSGKAGQEKPDMVIKAAGVPFDSPYIQAALGAGVPVEMSTSLFAKLSPATIVGVTGTRGKSTVTHLIADILDAGGKKIFRGGNVQGVSTLEHLPKSTKNEIAVLELDSWQLQGFGEAKVSPHIAVFTTFMSDHMNYYKGDMDRYLDDKANIFRHQTKNDVLVLGEQCARLVQGKYPDIKSAVSVASTEDVSSDWSIPIPGAHNRANVACALKAVEPLDIPNETVRRAVESFKGVPGRLEHVRTVNGVAVYNDTTATTPDATTAALHAIGDPTCAPVVLIAGGSDKQLPIEGLLDAIARHCKAVVLLPGTGTDELSPKILGAEVYEVTSMEKAVEKAFEVARKGDVLLLSPAFASFGLFKNEYHRGEEFLKEVEKVQRMPARGGSASD
ncbi:MAG: UDP-N-acetylmuramoyl-L-alanine--D-glutamate ligase [Candidatus Paceibacterota bacterium]